MKKSLALLLLAVLAPAIGLGWLALRGAEEQQIVLERRTAELYQSETEDLAAAARVLVNERQKSFADAVHVLLATHAAQQLAEDFTAALSGQWSQKAVGFAVAPGGRLLCPTARDASTQVACQQFLWDQGAFVGNKTIATVFPVSSWDLNRPEQILRKNSQNQSPLAQTPQMVKSLSQQRTPIVAKAAPQTPAGEGQENQAVEGSQNGLLVMKDPPFAGNANAAPDIASNARNVVPQQSALAPPDPDSIASQLTWTTSDFRRLTADGNGGVINRFVQDHLNMIFWVRPPEAQLYLFGCSVAADDLMALWKSALPAHADAISSDFVLAILDDKARPVAIEPAGATIPDWKKPFVATEIGETLPHWEATLYLAHPERLAQSAGRIRRTLILLIGSALAAIAIGGGLVFVETRRQLALAQQKTDFVSNVSHELKTPLTSIRMFAELMHDGRADPEKQTQYLRIITVEAERLTRLINNVLDFARPERRQRPLEKRPVDLHAVVSRVWESQELHFQEQGFATHWEAAPPPYPVLGDDDALTQVLVNLLSNAEKYSAERKEITVHSYLDGGFVHVAVLDRGLGVPTGEETKIFEAFYRAHDSLASGIQGAGLGLTLANRLLREQNGEILYQPRAGGGSSFTIKLPLAS